MILPCHPVQGLEWMLRREQNGDALGRSLLRLHPSWTQFVTQEGHVYLPGDVSGGGKYWEGHVFALRCP